jgi:hypothetical protein
LLEDVGITAIVIAAKITRCGLPAKIAVDTLVIDVVFAGKIFGIAICDVSHNIFEKENHIPGSAGRNSFSLLFAAGNPRQDAFATCPWQDPAAMIAFCGEFRLS